MRQDRASLTAAIVAFARGAAAGDADPVTRQLIGRRYRRWLERAAAPGVVGLASKTMIRTWTLGLVDHMALRTAAIDRALLDVVGDGARQVVVLGAGLDVRAWRLAELADVTVWEVDHPASQAFKRKRIGDKPPVAAEVRYAPIDFETDALADVLDGCGFDRGAPTFWIWEGVTMYLPAEATHATLAAISTLSAPGSGLAMTYMLPGVLDLPLMPQHFIHRLFGAIEEPLIGGMDAATAAAVVSDAGLHVVADGNGRDWARVHDRSAAMTLLFWGERLLVGRKEAATEAG